MSRELFLLLCNLVGMGISALTFTRGIALVRKDSNDGGGLAVALGGGLGVVFGIILLTAFSLPNYATTLPSKALPTVTATATPEPQKTKSAALEQKEN